VILVKPQFEVAREQVGKGGIVRDVAAQAAALKKSGSSHLAELRSHRCDRVPNSRSRRESRIFALR